MKANARTSDVHETRVGTGTAFVLLPVFKRAGHAARDPQASIAEVRGLAEAIGLDVIAEAIIPLAVPRPSTLIGSGKVEEIAEDARTLKPTLIVVDGPVSPVQQRNLEKAWNTKVLDRTGLILEIFGERARTREGQLQVELAHLTYHRSRLVRQWTHLERQRGGFGFLGGPGESQIELDRRLIGDRIAKLKRELEEVKRTRALHRAARRRVPFPVVALVGYTNAGKSTLFNALTRAHAVAEDKLFATLDPAMRAIVLPSKTKVIFSDTVGFISNLPTQLVAAFRATLEEVMEADWLIHVRDASHPDSDAQKHDVLNVLDEMGLSSAASERMTEVWNKMDLVPEDAWRPGAAQQPRGTSGPIAISALTGQGLEALIATIDRALSMGRHELDLTLAADAGADLAWLYRNTAILRRQARPNGSIRLRVAVEDRLWPRFKRRFPVLAGLGVDTESG